ncbi:unnamed protein product [Bursaphelenchus xylophilus]|uniref:(pine wood nematode) hypothetical protein n=1 Tax=Bursaphelenchus xylophilus TaxID=6326 RepID=A0A1I7SFR8_BURXY|nr:unnamed protein product [Bursaphelenchus xylophilus]CAG9114380.1 unnamed protein product [Bursaphelenchus xylophilus]
MRRVRRASFRVSRRPCASSSAWLRAAAEEEASADSSSFRFRSFSFCLRRNLAVSLRRNLEQEMRRPHKARRQPCPYCNSVDHNPLDCTVVVDRSVRRRPQIVTAGDRLGDNLESAGWVYRLLLRIL